MIDNYKGAWFGSAELKAEVMERLLLHRRHDEIIQGNYQYVDPDVPGSYKGCAIGCTLPLLKDGAGTWHREMERRYNIPATVAHLIDDAFEAIEDGFAAAAEFAVASVAAIAVGADLRPLAQELDDLCQHADNCISPNDGTCEPCNRWNLTIEAPQVIEMFKAAPVAQGARAMILVG